VAWKENLEKSRQDIQDSYFYNADSKFAFLVQGEMSAGKSICLNVLLVQRILTVCNEPETNFIIWEVSDREKEVLVLFKTTHSRFQTFILEMRI